MYFKRITKKLVDQRPSPSESTSSSEPSSFVGTSESIADPYSSVLESVKLSLKIIFGNTVHEMDKPFGTQAYLFKTQFSNLGMF